MSILPCQNLLHFSEPAELYHFWSYETEFIDIIDRNFLIIFIIRLHNDSILLIKVLDKTFLYHSSVHYEISLSYMCP